MARNAIVSEEFAKKFATEKDTPYARWVRGAGLERLLRVRNPRGAEARAPETAVRRDDLRIGRTRVYHGLERCGPADHVRMEGGVAVRHPAQRLAPAFQRIGEGAGALRGGDQRARGH